MKPIAPNAPREVDAFDKLPPHSIEAEMCALASMMLDKTFAERVVGRLSPDDFYLTDHKIVFRTLATVTREGRPVDAVILRDALKRANQLDDIGGSAYIAQILGTVPSAAHGDAYAETVKSTSIRRAIITLADDAIRRAYGGQEDAAAILSEVTRLSLDLAAAGTIDRIRPIGDLIGDLIDRLEHPERAKRLVPTGIKAFDAMFGGFPMGLMTLVAARPSMGKSLLIKDMIRRIAQSGRAVGLISVEETNDVIVEKAAAMASGYDNRLIHQGSLRPGERDDVIDAIGGWRELPIFVVDDASRLSDVESIMATMRTRHGCEAVFVDHVHRINGEPGRNDNRTQEVGKISTMLANAAKRLDVALVACAQLNRGTEHTGQKPKMSDLRDSGTLEQDARMILMLYREDYFHKGEEHWNKTNVLEVIVDKNSNGATGVCPLPINLAAQRIEDEGRSADYDHLYAEREMAGAL